MLITAKDRRGGRKALGRLGNAVEDLLAETGLGEDELVSEAARSRRDPSDWRTVACALALSAGIWTNDNDYLGTGVPTWGTDTLQLWLDRNPN